MKNHFKFKLEPDPLQLHKGSLFWHASTDQATFYPSLKTDLETDVCIVGGGMSGALIGNRLTKDGFTVVILDQMQPGHGSSNGNTGIIQYHSDQSLADFIKLEGETAAHDFYQLCHDAMIQLFDIVDELNQDVGFSKKESLYLSDDPADETEFRQEVAALTNHGFPAKYITKAELKEKYQLEAEQAILTSDDAMINPFKLIQALHRQTSQHGGRIFGNTAVTQVEKTKSDALVTITTQDDHEIRAKQVIFCTGYLASYDSLKDRDQLHSTYSLVTQPVTDPLWPGQLMIWDANDPYLYFRVTEDNRIIAGGLDETTEELSDLTTINRKAEELMTAIRRYYPELKAEPHYVWQSVFGVSKDEMPFIGRDPKHEQIFYALGFGGNGTCYSVAAADIISHQIKGQYHPYAYVVDPARKATP